MTDSQSQKEQQPPTIFHLQQLGVLNLKFVLKQSFFIVFLLDRKKKCSKNKKKIILKTSELIGEKAPEEKQGRFMVWRETNPKLASKN